MKTKQQQQSARRFLSYLSMYNASLVPCNSFNGKPIFKYIYLQNQFRLNNYGAQFARMQCLQKFGLNINFKFLKYIIHRRYVFFFLIESFSVYPENNVFFAFINIIVDITIAPLSIG